jgi:hypothetical protein
MMGPTDSAEFIIYDGPQLELQSIGSGGTRFYCQRAGRVSVVFLMSTSTYCSNMVITNLEVESFKGQKAPTVELFLAPQSLDE